MWLTQLCSATLCSEHREQMHTGALWVVILDTWGVLGLSLTGSVPLSLT